jgi:hypothetical protein
MSQNKFCFWSLLINWFLLKAKVSRASLGMNYLTQDVPRVKKMRLIMQVLKENRAPAGLKI